MDMRTKTIALVLAVSCAALFGSAHSTSHDDPIYEGKWVIDAEQLAAHAVQIKGRVEEATKDAPEPGKNDRASPRVRDEVRELIQQRMNALADSLRASESLVEIRRDGTFEISYSRPGVARVSDRPQNMDGEGRWEILDDGRILLIGRWRQEREVADDGSWAIVFEANAGALVGYAGDIVGIGRAPALRYTREE